MTLFDKMLLNTEQPAKVVLKTVNGSTLKDKDGKEAFISILSTDSQKANAIRLQARNRRIKGEVTTAEVNDEEAIQLLAELTTDWYLVGFDGEPLVDDAGNKLPCTVSNAKVFYSILAAQHWRDQVQAAAGSRELFIPVSANT